jgi:hypothetical protein
MGLDQSSDRPGRLPDQVGDGEWSLTDEVGGKLRKRGIRVRRYGLEPGQ